MLCISFIFKPAFPLGRVTGATALGGLGIYHGQQQVQIALLAPHQDGATQCRRCSHSTWALDDLWVALPWVLPAGLVSLVFRVAFWMHGRTNVAVISQFGQVVRHSGLCKFHGCALFREVSHQGHNEEGKGVRMPRAPNH